MNSVDDHTQNVSLRDVTFEGGTGFPIFRKESIGYVRAQMEQPDMVKPQHRRRTSRLRYSPAEKKKQNALPIRWTRTAATTASPMTTSERARTAGAFQRNLDAIRTLKTVETRTAATSEERAVLAQYVGWGGLANFLRRKDRDTAS